jgi:hypothetical protein
MQLRVGPWKVVREAITEYYPKGNEAKPDSTGDTPALMHAFNNCSSVWQHCVACLVAPAVPPSLPSMPLYLFRRICASPLGVGSIRPLFTQPTLVDVIKTARTEDHPASLMFHWSWMSRGLAVVYGHPPVYRTHRSGQRPSWQRFCGRRLVGCQR